MSVVLNTEFVSNLHPSANVYSVLFNTEYDINDLDIKNQISTFVFSKKQELSIVEMTKETNTKYTAKFLQSFDSLDSVNPVNLNSEGTYYTYVVVDSRNTEEKNKTAIHVYRVAARKWWRLEFQVRTIASHGSLYWRGCEMGVYDSKLIDRSLSNTNTPTVYCTATSKNGSLMGPSYLKTECIPPNNIHHSDISSVFDGVYATGENVAVFGHNADSVTDPNQKIILDYEFEKETDVHSIAFTDGSNNAHMGGVDNISIYYSHSHHDNSTEWVLHGTYKHIITNHSDYINIVEYNGSEWVLNGTYMDVTLTP